MKTMRTNLVLVLVGLLVLGFTAFSFGAQELFEKSGLTTIGPPEWTPGEIIVKFKKRGVSEDVIREINQRHGTSVLSISERGRFRRLRIPKNKTVEEMVAIYSRNPNVEYAEPNFIAYALMVPNDPYYSLQWHLDNPVYGGIQMQSAWNIETGNTSVIVAVVDTGITKGTDLANTCFVPGYDFVNNDTAPTDDNGHGTHVAGTIAQSTNNSLGVAGVAFSSCLMPVKVLNASGSGTYDQVANGIYYAADNGASVINLSLGGASSSITLEEALAYAYGKGVTIVAASGNGGAETVSYPAAYDTYIIAVGATRYDEGVTGYSSYYSNTADPVIGHYVDLTAPGGDLNVDQNKDGYGDGVLQQTFQRVGRRVTWGYYFFQGTSMATPHVAGVSALVIANGVTGPDKVRAALESTAEDKGTLGWDPKYGWGIVDAYAALKYSPAPIHDVAVTAISAPTSCVKGDIASVVVSVANQGNYDETFTVTLTDTTDAKGIDTPQSASLPTKGTVDLTFSWDTTTASLGNHILLAEASTVSGETDTADNSRTTLVTVKEPVHDVAVITINAPLEAYKGDLVSVPITVENQGTYAETTTVSLTDTTDSVLIGSQSVSLNAGSSTIATFNWDTTTSSIGDHTLKAEASAVTGETDTADNSLTTPVTIKEKPTTTMHVSSINMALNTRTVGRNKFTKALATITIVDPSGVPVQGATVSGYWSGATSDVDSGITDTNGKVTVASNEVKNSPRGTTYTFTVSNVVKTDWTYDSANNVITSNSISVP